MVSLDRRRILGALAGFRAREWRAAPAEYVSDGAG
jgi:hypothetical protein